METRWSGPLDRAGSVTPSDREGLVREVRSVRIAASPAAVYRVLESLGGDRGWLVWEGAWQLRGLLDRLAGGARLRGAAAIRRSCWWGKRSTSDGSSGWSRAG